MIKPTKLTKKEIDQIVTNLFELKDPGGRPSKYREEYCQTLIEYFNVEPYEVEQNKLKIKSRWFSDFPTIEHWCAKTGITKPTYYLWAEKHPEFAEAAQIALQLQDHVLTTNGLHNGYSGNMATLIGKNKLAWKDKIETDNTTTTRIVIIDSDDDKL